MPKIPTPGQVVLFHLREHRRAADGSDNYLLIAREATVLTARPNGVVDLWTYHVHPLLREWERVRIAPDGIPADRTWTFRPEDL